ncbi:uncharacterized protein LOC115620552 isoform X3 [Scaptodrosophila lebanonensis]|uniref:Uncharacterized protein LOC115620552 isoform X3 n=1 Tax=Drosophila lebanonensis TaxID=7225 RepID=A0A6J2T332_DROLE|nr:uncharacterized protein LOC115620552 isoform X3 [Scaptodrosophila lebanonensis]
MFNLLRRTRQRKTHKSKNYDVSDEEETASHGNPTRSTMSGSNERYRSFSELQSRPTESLSMKRATDPTISSAPSVPSVPSAPSAPPALLPHRRAVIEELEDFASEDDDDVVVVVANGAAGECGAGVKLAKTAATVSSGSSSSGSGSNSAAILSSWRSTRGSTSSSSSSGCASKLNINNISKGNGATARTTTVVGCGCDEDRNVATSSNEAAKTNGDVGQPLIGIDLNDYYNDHNIEPIDGCAQPISGTVIDDDKTKSTSKSKSSLNTQHSSLTNKSNTNTNSNPSSSPNQNQIAQQKKQSRLSLTNFGLQLVHSAVKSEAVNSNCESEVPVPITEAEPVAVPVAEAVPKVKRKTLQKSRDFLSEIFMARGRNHQHRQQHRSQQQQQQHQAKVKTAVDVIGQALAAVPATLAAAPTHLETNSDPANDSTNSYQMTMSNNSQKNFHRALKSEERESPWERQRRSNSADCEIRTGATAATATSTGSAKSGSEVRAHSVGPRDFIQAANVERHAVVANAEDRSRAPSEQANALQRNAAQTNINNNSNNNSNSNRKKININNSYQEQEEHQNIRKQFSDIIMGQTSAKPNEQTTGSTTSSRASTPREFRESIVTPEPPVAPPRTHHHQQQQNDRQLPKITVVDCSFDSESSEGQSPTETAEEVYYDFEQSHNNNNNKHSSSGVHITSVDEGEDEAEACGDAAAESLEDEVFETDIPTTVYQNGGRPWTRLRHVKLENVQEEAEEEDDVDEALELDSDELEHAPTAMPHKSSRERQSASSERSALKSDSNLSSSYADSGIGIGIGSMVSLGSATQQETPVRNCATATLRTPFVRDGNSTDCEETLLQCDELDDEQQHHHHHHQQQQQQHQYGQFNERLVCIESISLPDVVVESTTANSAAPSTTSAATTTANTGANANGISDDTQINININGASGNSLGNVHFIPIHVEGGAGGRGSASRSRSSSPNKQRSLDDTFIGKQYSMPPTIEIIEDGCILNAPAPQSSMQDCNGNNNNNNNYEVDILKQELKLQKARYNTQLDDAHKNLHNLEGKVGDMQAKIQKLEQELSLKQWNVERLQGELDAAHKDDEYVRKKLKLLEDEKVSLRHKYSDNEDEFKQKYDELEAQYNELKERYTQTQCLASSLQTQLASAQAAAEEWKNELGRIRAELEEQIRILKNALENSEAERKICEDKWQKEFEILRTHNREREDTLMTDCEWQMRQMQRQCKDKMDKSAYERKQAMAKAEELEQELQSRRKELEHLRVFQAQVNSLRGVVSEQEHSIHTLMERIDTLQTDLDTANENLEAQIEAVHKIKYQCDNAIYDKERQMIYRIDEVRNEAAAFWENKLYTEMTRLTNELESVYVDERREALDKLQTEHVEELRALTNRYTANEEEMRAEINELNENLELKKQDFLALRERSDNALLQTRMHLDRADREYQNAMCREEDRRVELEEKLKKEFELEKQEMEEKFRERLGQVKEEFAKELLLSTQDMVETHRKELETQKAKLQAEKDEALQELVERHRAKMAAAEERINIACLSKAVHSRNLTIV